MIIQGKDCFFVAEATIQEAAGTGKYRTLPDGKRVELVRESPQLEGWWVAPVRSN